MLFSDLEDSQIEGVVGGAFNKITGIQIKVSATGVGDNVAVLTSTNTKVISVGNYTIAYGFGYAYGFAITQNK